MHAPLPTQLQWTLGVVIVVYVAGMYGLGYVAQRRVHDVADFIVAGRRLPLSLAWLTLLATWFGAGTMLTVADEVRSEGVRAAALDPFGAGLCLLLAGLLVAGPMWRMGLLTLPEFFRRRFGPSAGVASALVMVPGYFGWIAAQFVALAAMLELFFGLPPAWGIPLVAIVGTGYTLMGGMWSVTLTDAVQMTLVLVGLVILAFVVLSELGGGQPATGWTRLWTETPSDKLVLVPRETAAEFWQWTTVLAIGALGNLPGQDLLQRVFASRSEQVARRACYITGAAYLSFGLIPVGMGLAAGLLAPESDSSILPTLAASFLSPPVAIVFTLALLSAVLSTIDSAIIAPSCVLAEDLLGKVVRVPGLVLNRVAVVIVAACSLGMAFSGEDAYSLLEDAYAVGLVGLCVPMLLGLYTQPRGPAPALASISVGILVWLLHYLLEYETFLEPVAAIGAWQIPTSLAATLCSLLAYMVCEPPWRWRRARL